MADQEKRYQVFVSSTYLDLVEERRAIMQALLELDCFPSGMEMFPAADEDQWTLIKGVIDLSDFYIVVVGGRYGSVTAEGVSFTEQEYDYAIERSIPVLGFVNADPGQIPVDKAELDPAAREKLEAFRAKVKERMVKEYSSPDELASVVSRGLIRAIRQHQRPGWVRGDQAMNDAVRVELAELRAALAEAERESAKVATGGPQMDESFEHGLDEVSLGFNVRDLYLNSTQDVTLEFTWDEIFDLVGPAMLDESPEQRLREIVCDHAWSYLLSGGKGWGDLARPRTTMKDDSWGRVLVQLRALGLIATGTKKRTVTDKSVYWRLTPAGDEYLVRLKATKRVAIKSDGSP